MLNMAAFIWSKTVKLQYSEILPFKITLFNWRYFKIYFCDGKPEFSAAIAPVLSVTWFLILVHKKQLCCLLLLWEKVENFSLQFLS